VTGLIKTILMLEREQILPNSGFETPNKRIPLDKWNLQVFESKRPIGSDIDRNTDSHQMPPLDSQERGIESINQQVGLFYLYKTRKKRVF